MKALNCMKNCGMPFSHGNDAQVGIELHEGVEPHEGVELHGELRDAVLSTAMTRK